MREPLLALLHLCDTLFPIGGFAHSDGLESATASRAVASSDDLRQWLDACLDETIGRSDGPTLVQAWSAFMDRDSNALQRLDEEAIALRPSSAARRASRTMGSRLLTTWQSLYPDTRVADLLAAMPPGQPGLSLPVAFAVACASAGIDTREAAEAFAYTRLAATVSSAMRLMPIGQMEAHGLLAEALDRVPAVVDALLERGASAETFAPALDIAAMTQQYVHSRLFRS
jgi:urease accessory protein